jgi:hypothetical protein
MRFEGDMEIKRFIDVPLTEFFTFHVYTTFTSDFAGMASSSKLQYGAHSKEEGESPDTRACFQPSRGLFRKSATHLCSGRVGIRRPITLLALL